MKNVILEKLDEIEQKEKIKIMHCVELGSRAWGFASPDSDYDVRFIYVREKDFYLRLDPTRDVIEWKPDETLDINGWDVRKALQLLYKSNPTLFEWNASPIVYRTSEEWATVSGIINRYFVAKSGLHHYLSMAKRNYRKYLQGETVRYKKYFYMLRPLLACKWILAEGTPPPILFRSLTDKYLEPALKPDIENLLAIKMNASEADRGNHLNKINEYIERNIELLETAVAKLPETKHGDWNELNDIFRCLLEKGL